MKQPHEENFWFKRLFKVNKIKKNENCKIWGETQSNRTV